jgi:hypothetical protein
MEIKDMIATYLLTRRIKQIEDQVKNKPEIKAKVEKKYTFPAQENERLGLSMHAVLAVVRRKVMGRASFFALHPSRGTVVARVDEA